MRKFWYLDPQYNNLLHLVDDIAVPLAELWRRFRAFSGSQQLIIEVMTMIVLSTAICLLLKRLARRGLSSSLRLARVIELYYISQPYR